MQMNQLPETGFVRLSQIIGNSKADPPIPAIIPVGKSCWWAGVKSGRFPKSVHLGPRVTAWRVEDIHALIASLLQHDKEQIAAPIERLGRHGDEGAGTHALPVRGKKNGA
jgi:prophage regulatory protein